ncbi:MAG: M20/M25/M40 family metallo-hydrolase [Gaiellales bacterium]
MRDADLLAAIDAHLGIGLDAMTFVHGHPELAHEEHRCSAHLASVLEGGDLAVELGVAAMPTAFKATLEGGLPGRSVGVVTLYDAVPAVRPDGTITPVHSCGHGPIAGGVVTAARALGSLREALRGSFVVVGCPADEIHSPQTRRRGGGKALSASAGLWDSLDAALYAHPEFINTVSTRSRWMRREHVRWSGTRSLRPGAPQPPLDAASQLLEAARLLPRDAVMLERLELDGDVEEGTGLVLSATVLLFADDEQRLEELTGELRLTLPDAEWESSPTVCGVRPDPATTAAVRDAFLAAGLDFVDDPPALPFATDFGNISRRVPAALIGIGREEGWNFHTDDGARQFASGAGEEATLRLAQVIALSATRLAGAGTP